MWRISRGLMFEWDVCGRVGLMIDAFAAYCAISGWIGETGLGLLLRGVRGVCGERGLRGVGALREPMNIDPRTLSQSTSVP